MSATPAVSAKVCIACGQDCSNKPRTKDPQGRYTCRECFDKLAARRQVAPARPVVVTVPDDPGPEDAAVLAAYIKDAPAPSLTECCPSCGSPLGDEAVVCTICGYNKVTGRAIGIKVEKGPSKAAEAMMGAASGLGRAASTGVAITASPLIIFLVCLVVFAAPAVLGLTLPDSALTARVISGVLGLVLIGLTLVEGFRTSAFTGLLLLVSLFIPILSLYWLYFIFAASENERLKAAWGAYLLSIIVVIYAAITKLNGG